MPRALLATLVAGLALLVAGAAEAGALVAATWTQNIQGIDLTVTNSSATCSDSLPSHVQQTITCPTGGLGANGSSTSTTFNVSLTMPLFAIDQFTTGGVIAVHTSASLVGPASINGSAGMATGGPNVGGIVTLKFAPHVMGSMYAVGGVGSTLLKVPFSVGKAGTGYWYLRVLTQPHYLTVDLNGWTLGTRTFTGLTSNYAPLPTPTVVAMGSFDLVRAPRPSEVPLSQVVSGYAGGGVVTLVAPSKISIDGSLLQRRTVSFTSLKLTFANSDFYSVHGTMVPEPGTLLLLGAGTACLLLFRRRAAQLRQQPTERPA